MNTIVTPAMMIICTGAIAREFVFLIENKRNENFRLEIDRIWMH